MRRQGSSFNYKDEMIMLKLISGKYFIIKSFIYIKIYILYEIFLWRHYSYAQKYLRVNKILQHIMKAANFCNSYFIHKLLKSNVRSIKHKAKSVKTELFQICYSVWYDNRVWEDASILPFDNVCALI